MFMSCCHIKLWGMKLTNNSWNLIVFRSFISMKFDHFKTCKLIRSFFDIASIMCICIFCEIEQCFMSSCHICKAVRNCMTDTIYDFFFELGMKPLVHLKYGFCKKLLLYKWTSDQLNICTEVTSYKIHTLV